MNQTAVLERGMKYGVLALVLIVFAIPSAFTAQQSKASLNDTQKLGQRIFVQRCSVCHTPPLTSDKTYGPYLSRERVEDREDVIRGTIREGREGLMPGFKYGLTDPQIDAIIEFLRAVPPPNQKPSSPAVQQDPDADS